MLCHFYFTLLSATKEKVWLDLLIQYFMEKKGVEYHENRK